jgi:hypothetical protein
MYVKKPRVSILFFNLCNNDFLIRQAKWVKSEIDYEKLGKNYGLLKNSQQIWHSARSESSQNNNLFLSVYIAKLLFYIGTRLKLRIL